MILANYHIFGVKRNTIIVNNLFTMSEGNISTYITKTQVVNAPISIVGFDNSVYFGDNSVARRAYKRNFTPTVGTTYNLSFFIEMEDGGAPVVGLTPSMGDFSLIINGLISTVAVTELVSGNLYRVSASKVSNVNSNFGCQTYNTQSARKFKISGMQLTEGEDLKPYKKTT